MQTNLIKIQGAKIKKYIKKLPVRKKFHFTGLCSNCDHPVDGKFCTNCGQSAKDFHRPFFSVVSESLGDALSLDNKFFHTIVPLFARPGYLTKEFMRGRRARYTPPFRLYLFLTFFAFLLLSHNHKPETDSEKNLTFQNSKGENVEVLSLFEDMIDQDKSKADSLVGKSGFKNEFIRIDPGLEPKLKSDTISPPIDISGGHELLSQNKAIKKILDMWRLNPALLIDNAFKKLSQTLLLVLPIFALFLALFYIRRKYYLLEHLLISLNFHSFIFVVVIVSELLIMTEIKAIYTLGFYLYLLIPLQLFLTLKFYYKQSWFKTFIKFLMLSFFYNILLVTGIFYSLISLAVE
ncbi:DUF3667 domain-containing protein [Ancylomarina euxinus]|uniref:DUF3667 domain-containing protein n=1 Tax=Ancylomarina euxinus TaxID=2283627 RepID=A0A425Y8P9_9BACT|nr:DUF3667 domain-containing protein [Ancylomarina euxinus]MCZ4693419.1 DUF3667 domain-containing protein [Ancylomarina euxinus]MUP13646.1 DUF3667 domain-containing protein [Ancylomarina euxinus]RRG24712.1 DUF3667 domain-containing protein [Ancylomarina euxinus]